MERTASRSTAFALTAGVGFAGGVIALIFMAMDRATGNSVAAHVVDLYQPFGTVPDPLVPWVFLCVAFALATICWAISLRATLRNARWTRTFSTISSLLAGVLLVFLFMVSEHGTAILPTAWRVACLSAAIYGAIAVLLAWLPTTDRIRA